MQKRVRAKGGKGEETLQVKYPEFTNRSIVKKIKKVGGKQ